MIMADKQNPGVQAGASRNQLGGWLHKSNTAQTRQTQTLIARFCVSQSMARTFAHLAYGESANDE
ncbi:hypothetical protein [Altererythrobacter sp. MF3-039]|uniref:hypothetical protein n=1 Tax=Altererythrobacter sp. MF3-039 TaxID=3252901 RepID=UPI00390C99E9